MPVLYSSVKANGDFVAFKNASGQYIDMQYNGNSPATWGGGVSGSRRMNIYIATVESLDDLIDRTAALMKFMLMPL